MTPSEQDLNQQIQVVQDNLKRALESAKLAMQQTRRLAPEQKTEATVLPTYEQTNGKTPQSVADLAAFEASASMAETIQQAAQAVEVAQQQLQQSMQVRAAYSQKLPDLSELQS